jgi:hypothetical protein
MGPKRQSVEKFNQEPNTDQPSPDTSDEVSPRLEGDTEDGEGREELD